MSQRVDREGTSARKASDPSKTPFSLKKGGGVVLALGLLVWKLKAVIGFVATKGKLLLLGLTKSSTLFSMLLSLGVYWSIWGWKFAAGLIACLYVHEMGHVAALRRFGIRASAPMFVPGLGAMVRLHQYPSGPREDARVGLAGPIWGLGASVMACGVFLATGWASWAAIARVSAWINLFNLMPIWQLDGGRGFRALSSAQRWMATAAIAMLWMTTEDSILILLLVAGVYRSLQRNAPSKADWRAFTEYVLVAASLAFLATLHVPGLR